MPFAQKPYTDLDDGSHQLEKESQIPPQSQGRTARRGLFFIAIAAAIGLGVFIGSFHPFRWPSTDTFQVTDCGRTSTEAVARGCVMEPMIYGWMPPHCQYAEVTNRYNFNKWSWFADENLTMPLTLEDLWQGKELEIWTGQPGYHTEHCLFLWDKAAYAQEERLPWLDRKSLSVEHASHCIGQLRDQAASGEGEDPITMATLGIYECDPTPWRK